MCVVDLCWRRFCIHDELLFEEKNRRCYIGPIRLIPKEQERRFVQHVISGPIGNEEDIRRCKRGAFPSPTRHADAPIALLVLTRPFLPSSDPPSCTSATSTHVHHRFGPPPDAPEKKLFSRLVGETHPDRASSLERIFSGGFLMDVRYVSFRFATKTWRSDALRDGLVRRGRRRRRRRRDVWMG